MRTALKPLLYVIRLSQCLTASPLRAGLAKWKEAYYREKLELKARVSRSRSVACVC